MMMLKIMLTVTIMVVARSNDSVHDEMTDWNTFLGAGNIFFNDTNVMHSNPNDKVAVLSELASILANDSILQTLFKRFQIKFNRNTENTESRRQIFANNLLEIAEHNFDFLIDGHDTWIEGVSQFDDFTHEEYIKLFESSFQSTTPFESRKGTPSKIDWRGTAVTSVKDQKNTTSCAAHCAAETVEGLMAIKNNQKPVSLSPQHIIDCFKTADLCKKGVDKKDAFNHVISHGLATLEDYPWTGTRQQCRKDVKSAAAIQHFDSVGRNEDDLKRFVAKGPVAVSIRSTYLFRSYKREKKIYDELCQKDTNINTTMHCVTVVGYTRTEKKNVWIIKNSWGRRWGHDGYIYMLRSSKNVGCIYFNNGILIQ